MVDLGCCFYPALGLARGAQGVGLELGCPTPTPWAPSVPDGAQLEGCEPTAVLLQTGLQRFEPHLSQAQRMVIWPHAQIRALRFFFMWWGTPGDYNAPPSSGEASALQRIRGRWP